MSEVIGEWKRFVISFDEGYFGTLHFMETFNNVIKKYCIFPRESITIRKKDGFEYKFIFDWQNEDICGIEVYRRIAQ